MEFFQKDDDRQVLTLGHRIRRLIELSLPHSYFSAYCVSVIKLVHSLELQPSKNLICGKPVHTPDPHIRHALGQEPINRAARYCQAVHKLAGDLRIFGTGTVRFLRWN